jgi:hypothetical protein
VLDLVDAQHSRDHLSSLPSSTIFFQSSPRRKVDRERHHELDYSRDADVALRVNAAARADLVGEGDGVRRSGLVSPGASLLPDIQNLRALSAVGGVVADRPSDYDRQWRAMSRRYRLLRAAVLHASEYAPLRSRIVPAAAALPKVFAGIVNQLAE